MVGGCISRDIPYGEFFTGTRTIDWPYLRYKDTCERDITMAGNGVNNWETVASDREKWRSVVKTGMKREEVRKRARRAGMRDH